MSKKSDLPQSPHHVLIYDEDWKFLEENYGPHSENRIGVSASIRALVHRRVLQLKSQATEAADARASAKSASGGKE